VKDLDSIYFAAREMPPEGRPAYLTQACEGDPALRTRVEQMLAVSAEAEAFVTDLPDEEPDERKPAPTPVKTMKLDLADAPDEAIGQTLGRYKLLERLGEGGCGVVYVAEQKEPVRRRVALKVIKLGMDTKQVVGRFEAERQALAMMDHPNIAKVLDAGMTDAGRLYFVMELVRGIKITDYCDQNHLTTEKRLDLFIQVCRAIQHAHHKGIIHRDIKPSNILVTLHDGLPVPKVIDFGIAKATEGRLTDATVYTQLHHFIGTPAYMSPEQAEMSGLDIDTRSDIYSLGVLLYELLTGATPFDAKELMAQGIDEMRRTIRQKEPVRPSTKLSQTLTAAGPRRRKTTSGLAIPTQQEAGADLRLHQRLKEQIARVRGDLDWIVMKCLEKDRARRYETVNGLAADIKRHLNTEPVVARPPSRLYEFQKTVRRHKFGFAVAAGLIIVLTAGVLTSTWQAVVATRARKAEVSQRIAAQHAQAQAAAQQKKAEAEKQRVEWLLYASKLMLAQNEFEAGNRGLALHYLGECQENLRGWEYRYLWTRINAKQTLVGHKGEVTSVAFSPDGQRIVTGNLDRTAKVWDAATGRELLALEGHTRWVTSVAFSPDGKRIITGAGEWGRPDKMPGEAKVWDAATGRELLALDGHTDCVWSVGFSPDGKRIVTGSEDQTARVWDAATGEEVLTLRGHTGSVRSVAFSPDGQRIVTGGWDGTAKVWNTATGQEILTLKGVAFSVAFSPDGQRIATGSYDPTAKYWDQTTGQAKVWEYWDQATGQAKVWDAATGQEILTLKGHARWVTSVAFSPDGKRIVTGSADQTARVWDAETGLEILALKGHQGLVHSVAFSPDGKRIVTGSRDGTAKVWDAEMGQEVPTLKGHRDFVSSIAFSPDGQRIVTGSGDWTAKAWNAATGQEVLTLGSPGSPWSVAGVWSVTFSPDGQRIVTGSNDKTAKVWDAATGQELLVLQHTNIVWSVAFSPDGKRIVTGSEDQTARVWDAATGKGVFALKGHTGSVTSVALSPDGQRIVSGSADQTAKVWDAATGKEVFALKGHTGSVTSVALSPDGQRIVSGSADQTARVWDAVTGKEVFTLKGHTGSVRSVAFSPDGQRIVTGSDDRTAKLWNAVTGQEAFTVQEHTSEVLSVAFSPDGQRIVTGTAGANAMAKVWYAPTTLPKADWEQEEQTGAQPLAPERR
jgi:WD40 repeat protein/serine/threonine protein kinase